MKKTVPWLLAIAGLALVAVIAYRALSPHEAPPAPAQTAAPAPSPSQAQSRKPVDTGPLYPLPELPPEKPLPALDTSDATMRNSLADLWSDRDIERRFHLRDFIRRVVASIDNLPRRKLALRLSPVRPAEGAFLVTGTDDALAIAPENAARYAPYLMLLDRVDPSALVSLYRRFYPLFQQAYVDLGYPGQYFNDRLVTVIDDLLAAPEPDGPVKLVRPKVYYQFADPAFEDCSAGQKILIRIGKENEVRAKTRLRAIRAELMRQASSGGNPR